MSQFGLSNAAFESVGQQRQQCLLLCYILVFPYLKNIIELKNITLIRTSRLCYNKFISSVYTQSQHKVNIVGNKHDRKIGTILIALGLYTNSAPALNTLLKIQHRISNSSLEQLLFLIFQGMLLMVQHRVQMK